MEEIAHGHQVAGAGLDLVEMPEIEVAEIDPGKPSARAV